jgi:hypothetical protein
MLRQPTWTTIGEANAEQSCGMSAASEFRQGSTADIHEYEPGRQRQTVGGKSDHLHHPTFDSNDVAVPSITKKKYYGNP